MLVIFGNISIPLPVILELSRPCMWSAFVAIVMSEGNMGAPSLRLKIYVGGMLNSTLILEARERFQHANSHEHYRIKGCVLCKAMWSAAGALDSALKLKRQEYYITRHGRALVWWQGRCFVAVWAFDGRVRCFMAI